MSTKDLFERSFGDIRGILNTTPLTQEDADKLWMLMFTCSTEDRQRFFAEIEPYVRETGFFNRSFHVPMFQDSDALDKAYENQRGYAQWGTNYYSDNFSHQLIYGVMIDARLVALQGAELDREVDLWVPDPEEFGELQGKVLLGFDPGSILAQDISKQEKARACREYFDTLVDTHYLHLDLSDTSPTLYLILEGRSVECTLAMGPLREIEGSEGKWSVKSKYDVIRSHERYEQDMEVEGYAYACARIKTFYGEGVHQIDIQALNESSPKKVFKTPDGKILRGYTFTTHM